MNTIVCKNCGEEIEIDKALEGQIEARVMAAEHKKHEAELNATRIQASRAALHESEVTIEILKRETAAEIEIAKRKIESELNAKQRTAIAEQDMLIRSLSADADSEKRASKQLRSQLEELMKSLRDEKQARANAELNAERRITEQSDKIREDAIKQADEKQRLKFAEYEKKITDTQKALEEAQRKASQGSQQNQGEVLELELESRLHEEFPFDEIIEVKKGVRGADIKQQVRNQMAKICGILLWETKNGKWQPAWIAKFKQDVREAGANIGIIVSQETPTEIGEMKHIESNIWVVNPKLATRLAAALRTTILQVDNANKMNAGKDTKMESLYQFLVGPEFRNRVEAIIENYSLLQDELEREKRASALKWARQEKAIRAVIDNTIGMYGDLQGITNSALPTIQRLELDSGEDL